MGMSERLLPDYETGSVCETALLKLKSHVALSNCQFNKTTIASIKPWNLRLWKNSGITKILWTGLVVGGFGPLVGGDSV